MSFPLQSFCGSYSFLPSQTGKRSFTLILVCCRCMLFLNLDLESRLLSFYKLWEKALFSPFISSLLDDHFSLYFSFYEFFCHNWWSRHLLHLQVSHVHICSFPFATTLNDPSLVNYSKHLFPWQILTAWHPDLTVFARLTQQMRGTNAESSIWFRSSSECISHFIGRMLQVWVPNFNGCIQQTDTI